jgi:hypothetical protein
MLLATLEIGRAKLPRKSVIFLRRNYLMPSSPIINAVVEGFDCKEKYGIRKEPYGISIWNPV